MILTQAEIKKAANELLHKATGLTILGRDATKGYEVPSLFVELVTKPTKRETKNFAKTGFILHITFFQEEPDELEQLELVDVVKKAFGMIFKVGARSLTVGEIDYDYIDQHEDKLRINVNFDYYENTTATPTEEVADELELNIKKEEAK